MSQHDALADVYQMILEFRNRKAAESATPGQQSTDSTATSQITKVTQPADFKSPGRVSKIREVKNVSPTL